MTADVRNSTLLQRVTGWFGGLPGKAADVLPVRVGGTEYRQSSSTPASVLGFDQASLIGDVLTGAGGNVTVALNNNSQLTGQLNNVRQVAINSGSNWTLTGDNTLGDLVMDGGQVTFGGNEIETQVALGRQPAFLVLEVRQTVGNDLEAVLGEGLADRRAQTTHGAGNESDFLGHLHILLGHFWKPKPLAGTLAHSLFGKTCGSASATSRAHYIHCLLILLQRNTPENIASQIENAPSRARFSVACSGSYRIRTCAGHH